MFYVIVCIIFYLIVCCFSVICSLLPMLAKDTCSAASIITRFSVNIVRDTFLKPSLSILFLLPRFPPLHFGAAISTPAFSTPAFSASPNRPFIRCKNLGRSLFRFFTIHAFDKRTDGHVGHGYSTILHSIQICSAVKIRLCELVLNAKTGRRT